MAAAAPVGDDAETARRGAASRTRLLPDRRRPRRRSNGRSTSSVPVPRRLRACLSCGRRRLATSAALAVVTALVLAVPLLLFGDGRIRPALLVVAILALGPASDLAVALVNRVVTKTSGSRAASRARSRRRRADGAADARRGADAPDRRGRRRGPGQWPGGPLPGQSRGRRAVRAAVRLARRRRPSTSPGDDELLAHGGGGDRRLNERHGEAPGGGARFLLFHRKRRWNAAEGCWMGWERKRGKLQELNALLRGSTTTGILDHRAAASTPPTDVRYVVTLDADTRLPRGAVGRPRRDDRPSAQPARRSIRAPAG